MQYSRKIKSLFVSTTYPADDKDWRGRFISNLVDSLSQIKKVQLGVWAPPGDLPNNVTDCTSPADRRWLSDLMRQGGIAHLLRTNRFSAALKTLRLLALLRNAYQRSRQTDLFHVNWLQNALPLFGSDTPAVIGVLGSDYKLLAIKGMPFLLRRVLRQRKSIIAPNAEWMVPTLTKHFGDISEIRPIPFGVDQRWYQINRHAFEDSRSHWIAVFRITQKKIGRLFDWGKEFFDEQQILHLIGPMQEGVKLPDWVKYHGPASPDDLCTTWFPKAAGFVTLSQHDEGRPQVILEAMAAGLPVVASDIPAHLDTIIHQKTGFIVTSVEEFKKAMTKLKDPETNRIVGNQARCWVEKEVGTWQDCANRYVKAYIDLLEAGS